MNEAAQIRANQMVALLKPKWGDLSGGSINLRREVLYALYVDETDTGIATVKDGLPAIYLARRAKEGDQSAYDLLVELGYHPSYERPKRPGGVDRNAARDFTVYFLSSLLIDEFPELFCGANDATKEGTSAVDMIRLALENSGLACIAYRGADQCSTVPRSMEKAVRRFRNNSKYKELFWDTHQVGTEEESCPTLIQNHLDKVVFSETTDVGDQNDRDTTPTCSTSTHGPFKVQSICAGESRDIPKANQNRSARRWVAGFRYKRLDI